MKHILDPHDERPFPVSYCKSTGWNMPLIDNDPNGVICMSCVIAKDKRDGN
jgi:hypothetical protein